MKKKNLYCLYEISDREFESKLLLSSYAIQRGFRAFILDRNFFFENINQFSQGIVIYKSIVASDEKLIRKTKSYGHKFVCIDEEGILQWEDEYKLHLRYGQKCLDLVDFLILLNERQYKLLENNYQINAIKNKILICGYPRIQFLKLLGEKSNECLISNLIKKKYKNYIFFPTSFPSNHVMGKAGYERSFVEALGKSPNLKQKEFMDGILLLISKMEKQYDKVLENLVNDFKDVNIILRPHPTENINKWTSLKKYKNFHIDIENPSFFYLKNAICTIQYGSTISIESYVIGKKTFQLKNEEKKLERFELTDHFNYTDLVDNYSTLKKKINDLIKKKISYSEINNSDLKLDINSCSKIIDAIDTLDIKSFDDHLQIKIPRFNKQMFYKSILWFLSKTFLIYLFPNFLAKGKFEILDNRYRKFHANYYNYKNRKKSPITDLRVKNAISLVYQNNLKNVIFKKIQKNNYIIDLIK